MAPNTCRSSAAAGWINAAETAIAAMICFIVYPLFSIYIIRVCPGFVNQKKTVVPKYYGHKAHTGSESELLGHLCLSDSGSALIYGSYCLHTVLFG